MKPQKLLLVLLAVWCLSLFAFQEACERDTTVRTPEFLMDMANSPALEAQGESDYFANGRNLQLPAPKSIARGFLPFAYGESIAEAQRAGRELQSPVESSAENLARGDSRFAIYCAVCHGRGGEGDGPVTKRGVPPPPSLLAANAKKMKDGEIYHIITLGRNNMPGHAAQMTRKDRWLAILKVRELQGIKK